MDPTGRLTGSDALKHGWFKPVLPSLPSVNMSVIKNLQEFKGVSILKRTALKMLITMCESEELDELVSAFKKIDKDGSGLITQDEL